MTVASVMLIGAATLIPQAGELEGSPLCIFCGSLDGVDALLNILLFLPLGTGLALSGTRLGRALLAILILSTSIEVAQFFLISGRDAALGDVLSNLVGGAIGFALTRWLDAWLNPSRRGALLIAAYWSIVWLTIQLLVSYSFAPALPDTHYYGQIARVFENMATFGGRVLSATIDTVSVPDFGFSETGQFHQSLENGAVVRAVVIPAGPTSRIAPIIRVADERQRQIALLGQDRADLVFGIYTGAVNLRLRPQLFRLTGVFPSAGAAAGLRISDTIDLRGRYRAAGVDLEARSREVVRSRHFVPSSALGWILILPMQWYVQGTRTELVLGYLWMAALLLPLGYWGFLATTSATGETRSRLIPGLAALAIILFVGLVLIPRGFGVESPSLGAWSAAAIGMAGGAALARLKRPFRAYH